MQRTACSLLCMTLAAGVVGCQNLDYAIGVAIEELRLLNRAVPIEAAITDDSDLTDAQRDQLKLILRARDYAEQTLGLNVGTSFRNFVNLHGEGLSWNLSGSRKDAFEPYVWTVPVVGRIPYIGFFDYEKAEAERERLIAEGYDTFTYEVDAFSTLGLLPDPVFSSVLDRSPGSLADTVIHECVHNTIWRAGDDVFNESLATFVARTACIEFLEAEYGANAPVITDTLDGYEDSDRFREFLDDVTAELTALYAGNITTEAKIAERDTIFEAARLRFVDGILPLMHRPDYYEAYAETKLNNAYLLINVRYNSDQDVFADVYERVGSDWSTALSVFTEAAQHEDPIIYLRQWTAN